MISNSIAAMSRINCLAVNLYSYLSTGLMNPFGKATGVLISTSISFYTVFKVPMLPAEANVI